MDMNFYGSIGLNPQTQTLAFLNSYEGVLEIEVANRLMFAGEFECTDLAGGTIVQYESVTIYDQAVEPDKIITARLEDQNEGNPQIIRRIVDENVLYFRLKVPDASLSILRLETYYDFYYSRLKDWESLGQFGLTVDDNIAYNRLEDSSRFTIDQQWPAFNDGTTVLTSTYQAKWSDSLGLKYGVQQYLDLSRTNVYAEDSIPSDDPNDEAVFPVSFIELLNLAALDYHVARMLGLGYIDTIDTGAYVYMAVYEKKISPNFDMEQNIFFSLPTAKSDYRLPDVPALSPILYGFPPKANSDNFLKIDAAGYTKQLPQRFIRLVRDLYQYEIPWEEFFASPNRFDTGIITKAVRYGIEYRPDQGTFVKPEISSDPDSEYFSYDSGGTIAETIPAIEQNKVIFVHKETNEGVHDYALYGVNWFSRVSPLSNIEATDETVFQKPATLLPPANVQGLFIQDDITRIRSTQAEQDNYGNRVRVQFDWNHLQNMNYQQASKVEFFFRMTELQEVRGEILQVEEIAGSNEVKVHTRSFDIVSIQPTETVTPLVTAGDESKYIGSRLMSGKQGFLVTAVTQGAGTTIFQIQPEFTTSKLDDPEGVRSNVLKKNYIYPEVGNRFHIRENLSDESNWTKLDQTIHIDHLSNYTATRVESDGEETILYVEGITGMATVTAASGIVGAPDIPGLFKVEFASETLPDHSEASTKDIFWEKGAARIPDGTGTLKIELRVSRIESPNPLVIWVQDPAGQNSAVQTGSNVEVNFHPSYKIYLNEEPANNFDSANLLPAGGNSDKEFYIAVRSIDDTVTPVNTSLISPPVAIVSKKIQDLKIPQDPLGPEYATRPDVFGKSTYTFDTIVDTTDGREPYGLIFYRANEQSILDALYIPDTVSQIRNDLASLPDTFYYTRFSELANVILEPDGSADAGKFLQYDGYRLPEPDHPALPQTYNSTAEKVQILQDKVNKSFVPLTERPVVFEQVDEGFEVENKEPVIRNDKGQLLSIDDTEFYPFPMVRKFIDAGGSSVVRFADFTLDGASVNFYFYFAREFDDQNQLGERSAISGPVKLINSLPPLAPEINEVITQLANPLLAISASIKFDVNPYPDHQNIKKYRIYRTTIPEKTISTRLMETAATIDVEEVIADTFDDLNDPPYGEQVFYRLIALREVINEQGQPELIPSKPSEVLEALLVDNLNPIAPGLIANYHTTPNAYEEVVLSWSKAVHNGKYYLYKMNEKGNWVKLYEIESNDAQLQFPPIDPGTGQPDFGSYPEMQVLEKYDAAGDEIFHRFKVKVENASGLLNLEEDELTI